VVVSVAGGQSLEVPHELPPYPAADQIWIDEQGVDLVAVSGHGTDDFVFVVGCDVDEAAC
jgi:hypothetical protein